MDQTLKLRGVPFIGQGEKGVRLELPTQDRFYTANLQPFYGQPNFLATYVFIDIYFI